MDTPLKLFLLIIFVSIPTTTVTAIKAASKSPALSQNHAYSSSSSQFGPILAKLGFRQLAAEADSYSTTTIATAPSWRGPATIFAPTDASLLTCPSCSIPLLLQEHAILGLYPFQFLRKLAFGTKIETLAPNRCLTITSGESENRVFVGGAEITHPDLYNDGHIVVHGLHGFVSHLSPLSCNIERMSSLSFPPPPPMAGFFIMRLMLRDVMLRLRISGYSVLALALRVKYSELLDLRSMTVFALDDASIFSSGQSYVSNFHFHVVPNRRLMAADLESLPAATALPTMEWGEKLLVTTAGGGGPLAPMRINYVKVTSPDLLYNLKIAVHGLSLPFPQINQTATIKRCRFDETRSEIEGNPEICEMVAPTASTDRTDEI